MPVRRSPQGEGGLERRLRTEALAKVGLLIISLFTLLAIQVAIVIFSPRFLFKNL